MCDKCYDSVSYKDITCPECSVNNGGEELCDKCFRIKLKRLDGIRQRANCQYFYKNEKS